MASQRTIGVLHPGALGSYLGAAMATAGHRVVWASEGRGEQTVDRAGRAGLVDLGTLVDVVSASDVLLVACDVHHALSVADAVADAGFAGLYVELNSVSPATVGRIEQRLESATVVDACVIGPPVDGLAVVHACGAGGGQVARLFEPTPVQVEVLDAPTGAASTLKACHSAYTKAVGPLLAICRAAATTGAVHASLLAEWSRFAPPVDPTSEGPACPPPLAPRFAAELREAADTFAGLGVPSAFLLDAAGACDQVTSG
jgi:hypothetical protein